MDFRARTTCFRCLGEVRYFDKWDMQTWQLQAGEVDHFGGRSVFFETSEQLVPPSASIQTWRSMGDDGAGPVAGWPHECVVARCRVSERHTRVRSVPAAGGSGRGPDQIQRHKQPLLYQHTRASRRRSELPRIGLPGEDRQAPALPGKSHAPSERRQSHGTRPPDRTKRQSQMNAGGARSAGKPWGQSAKGKSVL